MINKLTDYDEKVFKAIKDNTLESFKSKELSNIGHRKRFSTSIDKLLSNKLIILVNDKYLSFTQVNKQNIEDPGSNILEKCNGPFVYWNSKFSHSGITGYKVFEGYSRKMSKTSLNNLLNRKKELESFNAELNSNQVQPKDYVSDKPKFRELSSQASKKCRHYCQKLCYYSGNRSFTSKKSGKYNFKVAFLTLTTPASCTPHQSLKAFELFLDYLRRTANCTYIWKKELGELNEGLHYHILINNFIPYYIVSWKWKRLLLAQGVTWPVNIEGKETSSHYRIELPRSLKKINYYVSKYVAKECKLPQEYGYIWGKSEILDQCKEFQAMAEDIPYNEVQILKTKFKVVRTDYITHICVDLLKVRDFAPELFTLFEAQYLEFSQKITLPQKFNYV
jgi:hypothetical protein